MKFEQIILEKLGYIFKKYNLTIVEQRSNYIRLQSNFVLITISHNQLEKSNTLWIGKNDEKNYGVEIDNEALEIFFNSDLKLSQIPLENFIENLSIFFQKDANLLLFGDLNIMNRLLEYDINRSQKYTQKILKQQFLNLADKAWDNNDYKDFINYIDEVNIENVPQSYKIKYRIAKRELSV